MDEGKSLVRTTRGWAVLARACSDGSGMDNVILRVEKDPYSANPVHKHYSKETRNGVFVCG